MSTEREPQSISEPPAPAGMSRGDGVALGGIVCAAVLLAVAILRAPPAVGGPVDDGVYLATAKALAEGRGYRHIELPGEPYQTKYPILYPLLLSLVWRAWPAFPENMAAVQVMNVALWAVGSWFAYRMMRVGLGVAWWVGLLGVCVAMMSWATPTVVQTALSEPLFFALSAVSLWAACRGRGVADGETPRDEEPVAGVATVGMRGDLSESVDSSLPTSGMDEGDRGGSPNGDTGNGTRSTSGEAAGRYGSGATSGTEAGRYGGGTLAGELRVRGEVLWPFLAGLAAGGAYLTRSIGMALVAGVIAGYLAQRRLRAAVAAAIPAALAVGGWQAWFAWAAKANAGQALCEPLSYDLGYVSWLPRTASAAARVALNNGAEAALDQVLFFVPASPAWAAAMVDSGGPSAWALYVIVGAALALFVAGLWLAWKRSNAAQAWKPSNAVVSRQPANAALLWRPSNAALCLYIAFSAAIILLWPYTPIRFLAPLLPFTATLMLLALQSGLRRVAAAVSALFADDGEAGPARVRPRGRGADRLVMALAAVQIAASVRLLISQPGAAFNEGRHQERERLARLAREHVPPGMLVYANSYAYIYLRSGRTTVPAVAEVDPVGHFFPDDREALKFGLIPSEGRLRYEREIVRRVWPARHRDIGGEYVVTTGSTPGEAADVLVRTGTRHERVASEGNCHLFRVW